MKPLSNNKTPGAMLRMARMKRGVTQAELAKACGIGPGYASMLETGNRLPTQALQKVLCKFLRIDLDIFSKGCRRSMLTKKRNASPL